MPNNDSFGNQILKQFCLLWDCDYIVRIPLMVISLCIIFCDSQLANYYVPLSEQGVRAELER